MNINSNCNITYDNLIDIYDICINSISNNINPHYYALIFRRFYDNEIFKQYLYYDFNIDLALKKIFNPNDIVDKIKILKNNGHIAYKIIILDNLNYNIINYVKNILYNNISLNDINSNTELKYMELYVIHLINNTFFKNNKLSETIEPNITQNIFNKFKKYLKLLETKFYDNKYNNIEIFNIKNIDDFYDNWENIFCYYKSNNKYLICINNKILNNIINIINNIDNDEYVINYINNLPLYFNVTIH